MKDKTDVKEKVNLKEKAVENKIKKWLKDKGYWFLRFTEAYFNLLESLTF